MLSDRNPAILSPRLLPFPVIPQLLLFCFPWSHASETGKSTAHYFYIRLKDPGLLALPANLPHQRQPSGALKAFHSSAGDVANAVTVV